MTAVWQSVAAISRLTGTDLVIAKPTGTVDGDLLVFVGIASGGETITKPDASWNTHPNSIGSSSPLFWKFASSEPASWTFVVSGIATSVGQVIRINATDPTTPIDAAAGVTGTGNLVITGVTSGGADRLLFQAVCKLDTLITFTPPGTATERYDATAGGASRIYAGGDEVVGSGATGTRTWTPSGGANAGVGYMFAVRPATQTVTVVGFTPTVVFGTPTLGQTVTPSGFTPSVVFGVPSLLVEVNPTGFTPSIAFGTPTLVQTVPVDGFTVPVVFGTPELSTFVTVTGFDLPILFGTPTIILDNVLSVTGFTPNIVFGSAVVDRQPFVTATVYDHETGLPVGAGAVVQLFNADGTLLDTTVTDANGDYMFFLPFGFTDDVFTVVRVTVGLTDYQGVSEVCPVQT